MADEVTVTEEVVKDVAELAQLKVAEGDLEVLTAGMKTILELAEQMQSVDTTGVIPVSNPLDATQRLRADEVTESDQHELYQSVAPETEDGLYLVPRVVE
ncbi:MAG: Asp-tRNA(Asn)/Glu-tRNA(Gln) amidotransferase subunit GatC [Pseudomonadales bacterium]|nr:Asp-tRNA(Asn)/Glu-tRNA(Gln) amidotransferase subunit GatC [Pseudomonadales bacterium]